VRRNLIIPDVWRCACGPRRASQLLEETAALAIATGRRDHVELLIEAVEHASLKGGLLPAGRSR
jgi:hypothetical protein